MSYRFLNQARTLVLCDDRVIAWNPGQNEPIDPQPNTVTPPLYKIPRDAEPAATVPVAVDEMAAWREAGSHTPDDMAYSSRLKRPPADAYMTIARPHLADAADVVETDAP